MLIGNLCTVYGDALEKEVCNMFLHCLHQFYYIKLLHQNNYINYLLHYMFTSILFFSL